jgi:hypothetical protein
VWPPVEQLASLSQQAPSEQLLDHHLVGLELVLVLFHLAEHWGLVETIHPSPRLGDAPYQVVGAADHLLVEEVVGHSQADQNQGNGNCWDQNHHHQEGNPHGSLNDFYLN